MNDPIQNLKQLPWLPLFQIAGVTVLIVGGMEVLLAVAMSQNQSLLRSFLLLATPPLGIVLAVAVGIGIGAIALVMLERFRNDIFISLGVMWALIGTLAVMLWVRQLFPLPTLMNVEGTTLVGLMIGVFYTGKRYWR
ncbi:MAG: hypothetical protein KME20_24885 [Kaiparowitsia implicata GSE-PSE-MK54-09C]|jgi:ribose/xylose/arabinose/galactoside ABC-type transport system permease subunit|nr:hypothetical protein [Kaiparowitsia implicata GSE-PSE-MK54-09C]